LGLDLRDGCASLPRSVEARPCKDDHDSQSPEEAVEPFFLLLDVDCPHSCAGLLAVVPPRSPFCRLDRCVVGIGETPLEGLLEVATESEEDDAAPVSTGSNSLLLSSNEMSLRLRGRIVDVVLLEEGKTPSLLFIVAAAADNLDLSKFALGNGEARNPTCQSGSNIAGASNSRSKAFVRPVQGQVRRTTCGALPMTGGLEPLVKNASEPPNTTAAYNDTLALCFRKHLLAHCR
jgi:hypothetical protein